MKIAMISLYLPSESKQGVGYQAHYMANALIRARHEVTLFSPCKPAEGALYRTVTVAVGESLRTFRFAWNLRKIDYSSFDVIHAHGDDYWLWNCGKPHVRTMHGSCIAEALHIPKLREKLRMVLLGLSEILATVVADCTLCVSQNTRRYYPWLRNVIMNGVDLSAFRAAGAKEAVPTILFVGTYANRKRGKMLMEIFQRQIRPALPEANLWMVCNDAPEEPGVTVFGHVAFEELTELYRRAWVFCLPSTYEGFGVPYIEAMASGTPAVATPNVGACEVLENGEWGVIAEDGSLGEVLLDLLRNRDERERLAELGLERAQEFGWERITESYERVYADLIQRRSELPVVATAL